MTLAYALTAQPPAPTCEPRAFVTRTCERGVKGCDILHDRSYRIEDCLDKLAAAGIEISINGSTA